MDKRYYCIPVAVHQGILVVQGFWDVMNYKNKNFNLVLWVRTDNNNYTEFYISYNMLLIILLVNICTYSKFTNDIEYIL